MKDKTTKCINVKASPIFQIFLNLKSVAFSINNSQDSNNAEKLKLQYS